MPLILIFCHSVALSVMLFFKVVFAAPDLNMLSLVCSFCNLVFFKVIFDATNPCAADHRHRPHPLLLDGLPGGRTAAQGKWVLFLLHFFPLPLFSWGWQARSKKLEEEEEEDTVYSVVFVFFTNTAYDCTHNIDEKVSDKNGGLFPKIDKKNLLTVPELVTPPGTVDEEEEASISVSQPNAIESINCSFFF